MQRNPTRRGPLLADDVTRYDTCDHLCTMNKNRSQEKGSPRVEQKSVYQANARGIPCPEKPAQMYWPSYWLTFVSSFMAMTGPTCDK